MDREVFRGAPLRNDVGGNLVRALEDAYLAIRQDHPDVPEAVIVISSSASKYGHFAQSRWNIDGNHLPEIMISAEGLQREPRAVLATLMHEAAHGIAATRGVKDVSGKGKYHNKAFRRIAEEVGLVVDEPHKVLGHSLTRLPEDERPELIEELTPRLVAWREFEVEEERKVSVREREISVKCLCPRRLRILPSVADQGPLLCGVCESDFQ